MADVQRNSSPLGNGQRRNLSSMTKGAGHDFCRRSFGRPALKAYEPLSGGYDLTTRRGRERLYLFCSAKRPRHVSFPSPCRSQKLNFWRSLATRVSYCRWNGHLVSEIASSWLSAARCNEVQCSTYPTTCWRPPTVALGERGGGEEREEGGE